MANYTQNAQQVLKDGQHFADTHSPEAAAEIVRALNDMDEICIDRAVGQRQIDDLSNQPQLIAAYLDAEADKRARRRQFTQGIRFAAQEVRAGMWKEDEAAPEGERSYYNQEAVDGL